MRLSTRRLVSLLVAACAVPWALSGPGGILNISPLAMIAPRDMAVASDGSLWVVDSGARRVVHFSADGASVLSAFETPFADVPTGLALATDGTLFITDHATATIFRRDTDGTVTPVADLGALGLSDPLGLDLLPTGQFVVLDGVSSTGTVNIVSADGLSLALGLDVLSLGMSTPTGVAVGPLGNLWLCDADFPVLLHIDLTGLLLGTVDLTGLGVVSPSGLASAPDGTYWTIDGYDARLHHHTAAGLPAGPPQEISFSSAVGLGIVGATGLSRDAAGHLWVADAIARRVHRLSADATSIELSFDFPAAGASITEIDVAPDGTIYLTDPGLLEIFHLSADGSQDLGTLTNTDLGVSALNSLVVDNDGSLWVVDPIALRVSHVTADGTQTLSSFPLPPTVPNPTDIELAPDGTLWVANGQAALSTLVHFNRDGSAASPTSVFLIGSIGLTTPESFAVLDSGDLVIADPNGARLVTIEGPPPVIAQAIYVDVAQPPGVSPGDQLILVFDQPIILAGALQPGDFSLSLPGDSLGDFTAAANPFNPKDIILTLGSGASLTVPGAGPASSAIDISASILPGTLIDALTGTSVSASSPRDVQFPLIASGAVTVGPAGGEVRVIDSPDAVYRNHRLNVAPEALGVETQIALEVPSVATGLVNAVEISPNHLNFLNGNSTLTLGYTEHDLSNGDGGDESNMRIHQIVEQGDGSFAAIPLPGLQVVDPDADTVTAPMPSTNPLGAPGPGIFATLPLDTLDDRSITITEVGGAAATASTNSDGEPAAVLTVGGDGLYTRHCIVFPGYVESPTGITVRIRSASIFERQGFPISSGAIFTLESTADIETPVEITVEFRPEEGSGDVVHLDGTVGNPGQMRLVRRCGLGETFGFLQGTATQVNESTVLTTHVVPLTASGVAVYGLAVDPNASLPTTAVTGWSVYH
jgi:sugar lactone lactonase YvrE